METIFNINYFFPRKWFKSYYVVWKLPVVVVFLPLPFLFKSYYVVWKPAIAFLTAPAAIRLNRTM